MDGMAVFNLFEGLSPEGDEKVSVVSVGGYPDIIIDHFGPDAVGHKTVRMTNHSVPVNFWTGDRNSLGAVMGIEFQGHDSGRKFYTELLTNGDWVG